MIIQHYRGPFRPWSPGSTIQRLVIFKCLLARLQRILDGRSTAPNVKDGGHMSLSLDTEVSED